MMWFGRSAKNKATPPPAALVTEQHVSHYLEAKIATFLVQKGRLGMSLGKPDMQVVGMRKNSDGSIDYTVRTDRSTSNVHIDEDGDLKLLA